MEGIKYNWHGHFWVSILNLVLKIFSALRIREKLGFIFEVMISKNTKIVIRGEE